jgi:hypothetical protein
VRHHVSTHQHTPLYSLASPRHDLCHFTDSHFEVNNSCRCAGEPCLIIQHSERRLFFTCFSSIRFPHSLGIRCFVVFEGWGLGSLLLACDGQLGESGLEMNDGKVDSGSGGKRKGYMEFSLESGR